MHLIFAPFDFYCRWSPRTESSTAHSNNRSNPGSGHRIESLPPPHLAHGPPRVRHTATHTNSKLRSANRIHTLTQMARGTRKRFKGAVPLTLFAIPAAGGALAYGLPPSCVLRGVTSRMPAFQGGCCGHRLSEDGRQSDARYSRRTLRRARGGQVGAAVQVISQHYRVPYIMWERMHHAHQSTPCRRPLSPV